MTIINVIVKGITVATFGPFASQRDARMFVRNNRDKFNEKFEGYKINYSDLYASFDELD